MAQLELTINAAGDIDQLVGAWTDIDEGSSDDGDATVVENTTAATAYRYILGNLDNTALAGTINHVTVYAKARTILTGFGDGRVIIKSGATTDRGTPTALGPSFAVLSEQHNVDPNTALAWTWAAVNALQAGVDLMNETDGKDWADPRCTTVYVVVDYTAIVAPTVTTQAASSVEDTTATGNGNITNTGGENCDKRGIVYGLTSQGDPGGAAPGASGYDSFEEETDSFGTGAFTRSLTGLSTGRTYYARAYAHNSAGYNYGSEISFLTKPAAPTNVQATDGDHNDKVVITWTKATGATQYQVYRDGTPLGWLGDVATHDDPGADAPTVTPGSGIATDGGSTAHVSLDVASQSANNGTTHTYKVRAKNAIGESVDSSTNTGYRGVGALTYQWYRSAGDSDADYSVLDGATTDRYDDTTAPAPTITHGSITASDGDYADKVALANTGASANVGAGRYYKCLVSATGAESQYSTADRGYRGVGALTYQWYRSAGDSDASYSILSGATAATHNDTTAPAPTITKGTVTASDGSYTNKVRLNASGYGTNNGAGRYYKCYHTATGATSGYTSANRGYRAPGTLNRQWQKSAADSPSSYSNISGATSDPYDYMGAPAPTITPGAAAASDGAYPEHVALSLSGQSANNGAGRYYRAKYTADGCTTQYTSGNRGYRGVGSLTYQWQRSSGDSDADYSNISGATSSTHNDTGAPVNGDGRYYQCIENATGAAQQTSASDRGYRQQIIGPFPTHFRT